MKLIKKMKKGFTLVELVVVIAIIAILAGVSVGVYVGITSSAKKAADSEIITQLNTKLRADNILEGRNNTAKDAYDDAFEIGFDLAKMTPQYGDHYIWDEEHDLFAVTKGSGANEEIVYQDSTTELTSKEWKKWIFTAEPKTEEERSQFYTGTETKTSLTVKSGFDAGLGSVTELKYENNVEKEVVIRTNSVNTDLGLNAPNDEIYFYGTAGKIAGATEGAGAIVKESSLHIDKKAEITLLKVEKGHVENAGTIDIVYATTDQVSITNTGDIDHAHATGETEAEVLTAASKGITFDYDENVKQNSDPDVYHHVTTEEANGNGDAEGYGEAVGNKGIVERDGDGKVTETEKDSGEFVPDAKANEIIEEKAKEEAGAVLPETFTIGDGESYDFALGAGIEWSTTDATIVEVANGVISAKATGTATVKANDKECVVTVTDFHAGSGSADDEYICTNVKQILNITKHYSECNYYKADSESGIFDFTGVPQYDDPDEYCYAIIELNGYLDCNNMVFDNLPLQLVQSKHGEDDVLSIKNGIFNVCINDLFTGSIISYAARETHLENLQIRGTVKGTSWCSGLFMCVSDPGSGKENNIYIKNVVNTATLESSAAIGAYWCQVRGSDSTAQNNIYIEDSFYEGNMNTSSGANSSAEYDSGKFNIFYKFSSEANWNRFKALNSASEIKDKWSALTKDEDGYYKVSNKDMFGTYLKKTSIPKTNHTCEGINYGDHFTTAMNVQCQRAVAVFTIGPDKSKTFGNCCTAYIVEELSLSETLSTSEIIMCDITVNSGLEQGFNGTTTYNIKDSNYGTTYTSAFVEIYQYDSTDKLIQIDYWNLKK